LIVPLGRFRRQVALLKGLGFTGVSLRQWAEGLEGRAPLPAKPIVITFDDGYFGVHEYALPVLRRAGFAASVYVIAEDLTSGSKGARAYPVLTARQLRDWIDAGFEVGCHSLTHPRLDGCTEVELRREIVESRAALERVLGTAVHTFAYPYGTPSQRVIRFTRDHGYLAALGIQKREPAGPPDLFSLPRIPLGYAQHLPRFLRRLWPYLRRRGPGRPDSACASGPGHGSCMRTDLPAH
jgi:peptidoglycan/xylan/chitin deacetylase (PgdA/CDA1 family)